VKSPRQPRSSRVRYREFVDAYRAKRLDALADDDASTGERPDGESGPGDEKGSGPGDATRASRRRQYLREYLRWLWPHRLSLAALCVLALGAAGLQMIEPLFMRFIIDNVLLAESIDQSTRLERLQWAGGAFLAVILISSLITVARDYRQRLLNVRVMLALRRALFDRLLHLPCPGCGR
jgi:ATP-binding cassette subfamily B protein